MFNNAPKYTDSCMFECLGSCSNQVSRYICNMHSVSIFGLYYKMICMTDANNDTQQFIVTYLCTNSNWSLPLFKVDDAISCDELCAFATRAASNACGKNNKKYDSHEIFNILSHKMNLNAYYSQCQTPTWLEDNPNNCVIMHDETNPNRPIKYLKNLPPLHRELFAYMLPSHTEIDNNYSMYIDTVTLVRTNLAESPCFTIINKPRVLKYTKDEHCVATPLVLSSIRYITAINDRVTYKKTMMQSGMC